MKLKPFTEILKMTKEGVDKALAPVRAKQVQTKANLKMAELDEQIITAESKIHEMCVDKDVDFEVLIDKLDEVALFERRKKQYQKVLSELFPND